jgi:hypothetical protein
MSAWERDWRLPVGPLGLKGAEFRLKRRYSGPIDFYTMKITTCGNAEAWSNCRLVSRGRYFQPWGMPKLEPFDPKHPEAYEQPILDWLDTVTAATMRLEGELEPVTKPEEIGEEEPVSVAEAMDVCLAPAKVTMFIAKNAVRRPAGGFRDLLIVTAQSKVFGDPIIGGGGDGTGHGNPHP